MLIPATRNETVTPPENDVDKKYRQWISANGTELITSKNTLVLITNPFEAIYAAYATVVRAKVFQKYGSQFLYTSKGGKFFFISYFWHCN